MADDATANAEIQPTTREQGEREGRQGLYAEVSREMVGLYKEIFGRGPTKAKTLFADKDTRTGHCD